MQEIFGPILTVYVYPDSQLKETIELAQTTSPFALTGAIYAEDLWVVEVLDYHVFVQVLDIILLAYFYEYWSLVSTSFDNVLFYYCIWVKYHILLN